MEAPTAKEITIIKGKIMPRGRQSPLTEKKTKERADRIDIVYRLFRDGMSRSELLKRLQDGTIEGIDVGISRAVAHVYINEALERFKVDNDPKQQEKERLMVASRYDHLYQQALKKGQLAVANRILESKAKLFGLDAPQKIEFDNITIKLK